MLYRIFVRGRGTGGVTIRKKWLLGSKLSKERPPVKSIKKGVLSYSRDWVASKENTK